MMMRKRKRLRLEEGGGGKEWVEQFNVRKQGETLLNTGGRNKWGVSHPEGKRTLSNPSKRQEK